MEQFEIQKPISQLFVALKSHFLECEPFSYRSFRTTEQNPLFQKNYFCDVITSPLYAREKNLSVNSPTSICRAGCFDLFNPRNYLAGLILNQSNLHQV